MTTELHDIGAADVVGGAYAKLTVIRQYRFGANPQGARLALRIEVFDPPSGGLRSAGGHIERADVPLTHRAASDVLSFFHTVESRREPGAEVEFKAGSIMFGIGRVVARQLLYVGTTSQVASRQSPALLAGR